MTKKDLQKKIEIMREELHDLIDIYGIDNDTVLDYSQELDELLYEFQKSEE